MKITIGEESFNLIRALARSNADKGRLLDALMVFAETGKVGDLDDKIVPLFDMCKHTMVVADKRRMARTKSRDGGFVTCDDTIIDNNKNAQTCENLLTKNNTFGLETTQFVTCDDNNKISGSCPETEKNPVISTEIAPEKRKENESEKETSPLTIPYVEKDKDKEKISPPIIPPVGSATLQVVGDSENKSCLGFDEFWEMYGKKVDKKKCEVAYARVSERQRKVIKEKLPEYVRATPDIQFRKNPLTWLHGACWQDDVPVRRYSGSLIGETICGWSEEEVKRGAEEVGNLF